MILQFNPGPLSGTIQAVPSKSASHRALICAALADGRSVIKNMIFSEDILATIDCLEAMGAKITRCSNSVEVEGIGNPMKDSPICLPCRESGSTLRFLIPLAAALGYHTEFTGYGKLPSRPITPYLNQLPLHGIEFQYNETMPFAISGTLRGGEYKIPGNISSQFITGLLFALPLLKEDSIIAITGAFESKPYVLMTLQMLSYFNIHAELIGNRIMIPGNQSYRTCNITVEGDFSQAAFFLVAGAFSGPITVEGLSYYHSLQGDKVIVDLLEEAGADVLLKENSVTVSPAKDNYRPLSVSVCDIPDLVPILSVFAAKTAGESRIFNAERLRIKESDRLSATAALLNSFGADTSVTPDGLIIKGFANFHGCTVSSENDHRIAMSAAVAAVLANAHVILNGAEAVRKSYPAFYKDYQLLGGNIHVLDLEQDAEFIDLR